MGVKKRPIQIVMLVLGALFIIVGGVGLYGRFKITQAMGGAPFEAITLLQGVAGLIGTYSIDPPEEFLLFLARTWWVFLLLGLLLILGEILISFYRKKEVVNHYAHYDGDRNRYDPSAVRPYSQGNDRPSNPPQQYQPRDYAPPQRQDQPRDYAPPQRQYQPRDYAPPQRQYQPPAHVDRAPQQRQYVAAAPVVQVNRAPSRHWNVQLSGTCAGNSIRYCQSISSSMDIGRDPRNTLMLNEESVSRRQLRLTASQDGVYAVNMSQTNPTRINGVKIGQPMRLADRDSVTMGHVTLEFRYL